MNSYSMCVYIYIYEQCYTSYFHFIFIIFSVICGTFIILGLLFMFLIKKHKDWLSMSPHYSRIKWMWVWCIEFFYGKCNEVFVFGFACSIWRKTALAWQRKLSFLKYRNGMRPNLIISIIDHFSFSCSHFRSVYTFEI